MLPPPPQLPTRPLSLSLSNTHPTYTHSYLLELKLNCKSAIMQKLHSVSLLFLLIFLISTSQSSARKLAPKEGKLDVKISSKEPVVSMEISDSFNKLMGLEECDSQDEECLKRRALEEAHLDYIYTQQHRP